MAINAELLRLLKAYTFRTQLEDAWLEAELAVIAKAVGASEKEGDA